MSSSNSGGLQPLGGGSTEQSTPLPPPAPTPTYRPATDFYEEKTGPNWGVILGAVGAVLVVVALALFFFRPLGPAAKPTTMVAFAAASGDFTCDVPANWQQSPLGTAKEGNHDETTSAGIIAESGGGQMKVTFSTVRGLTTGQLLFGNDITPGSMQGDSNARAVAKLNRKGVSKLYAGYEETKQPSCPSAMGGVYLGEKKEFVADAVLYEFTAKSAGLRMRTPIHGYRAVVAGPTLIASVLCHCSERDWEALKPEFLKFIGSIKETKPAPRDGGGGLSVPGAGNIPLPAGLPGR